MQWLYLVALVVSISGLLLLDWRHKVAFFNNARRTTITITISMIVFIIWDLLGIHLGIFFSGGSPYALPFMMVPDFPVEELLFLFLLSYVTLLLYLAIGRRWKHIY
jgi:lycopene cyclase domain-containing protein